LAGELGGQEPPGAAPDPEPFDFARTPGAATTLVVIATDAALNRPQAKRVALMAQDGLARAIRPVHSPLDGDSVFVLATGAQPLRDPVGDLAQLGAIAADCAARAIARGVYEARALAGMPAYRDLP
jgi:L-aminopeptidase/D-esterase-like protein